MNTDSIFQIGHDHKVCEDFSLSGISKDFSYIITCDGCSSSTSVDIGARILSMVAEGKILNVIPDWNWSNDFPAVEFGKFIINAAAEIYNIIPQLHPEALDCTLLIAFVTNVTKKLTVVIYGDGVFIHRRKNNLTTIHVNLANGSSDNLKSAPDYLSYYLDSGRMKSYNNLIDNKKEIYSNYNGLKETNFYKPHEPFVYECNVEAGDVISVISDGINSFKKADNTSIDWQDLVDEFTLYKTTEGEFVQRRISAFKRKCLKEGITHSDDISIATIIV